MGGGPGIAASCSVGCTGGLDLMLLGLWCRLAAAALIGPLAWEPPSAVGAAQEMAKSQKKKKKKELLHTGGLCSKLVTFLENPLGSVVQ